MADPCLILFDDAVARRWHPFTATRPAGELRLGAFTLRERAERVFGAACIGHLAEPELGGFEEPGCGRVIDPGRARSTAASRAAVYLSSRVVPAWSGAPELGDGPALLRVGAEPVGWFAPAGTDAPDPVFFDDPAAAAPADARVVEIDGYLLDHPWSLIEHNADQVARDILALFPDAPRPELAPGVHVVGTAPLILGHDATVDPGAVIDLRDGPVWVDDGARIASFTRLAGPAYIGRGSSVLGGPLAAVTIGPACKVHGEMEESVVLGFSNKAHDGFLGHSYLGCWVNLGALTTNSDLKNNYGTIRMWTPDGAVDTGRIKLGCLLGDHVKTAIGTLLNTGTVVGTGANLFGAGIPPKYVPPFRWGLADPPAVYELERFLASAETVMRRRGVELGDGQRGVLTRAWQRAGSAP